MTVGGDLDIARLSIDDASEEGSEGVGGGRGHQKREVREDLIGRVAKPHCVAK